MRHRRRRPPPLNVSTRGRHRRRACEVPVAKHGNRAASSKVAADTLEALGPLIWSRASAKGRSDASPSSASPFPCSRRTITPHERHPAAIRKAIGRRTIFNLTGPMANPLTGVTATDRHCAAGFCRSMAEA
ncbi:MAG: hypothetical protein IPO50_08495 [Sphingomonadales bacterium]|nr:hypothetical protein [Sphingomonadales bacterium]